MLAFQITDGLEGSDPGNITKAFRRAVMHCVARELADSDKALPLYFCGHERDGRPAGRNKHAHLGFAFDADANLLLVVPPHLLQHQEPSSEECKHLRTLSNALARLRFVKAGRSGVIHLAPATLSVADPLVATSKLWRSATPYKPTRHGKKGKEEQGLIKDVLIEASRRNLPQPEITVMDLDIGARGGVSAMLQLQFKRAVKGPLLLGRTMHFGGGLFKSVK